MTGLGRAYLDLPFATFVSEPLRSRAMLHEFAGLQRAVHGSAEACHDGCNCNGYIEAGRATSPQSPGTHFAITQGTFDGAKDGHTELRPHGPGHRHGESTAGSPDHHKRERSRIPTSQHSLQSMMTLVVVAMAAAASLCNYAMYKKSSLDTHP